MFLLRLSSEFDAHILIMLLLLKLNRRNLYWLIMAMMNLIFLIKEDRRIAYWMVVGYLLLIIVGLV